MGMNKPLQDVEKRKALSIIIVDSKRPNVFWSLAMLLMLILRARAVNIHHTESQVLWMKSYDPVVTGFNAVTMNIKLVSPCMYVCFELMILIIGHI